MPRYQELPEALRVQITTLFTPANYCFLTSENGRSPTFYFAKGGLVRLSSAASCGRLRTMHDEGPLIDITTSSKRHYFFAQRADREKVRHIMTRMDDTQLSNGDAAFFMELVGRVYRTVPQPNDYHYEYTVPNGNPNRVTRRHPSGGRVQVAPRLTQQNVIKLIDRLLADNCAVKIDGRQSVARGVDVNRVAVVDPTAYLASL